MLNTFFCCKKQKDTKDNKDNKFCLCCYKENITTKPCVYDKCDYAMCKKCYKKYYKLNIKCPACRQINTRIYQKRKTCCCLKRNIPNVNRYNERRHINNNDYCYIDNKCIMFIIYIFLLLFIFGLILLGRFIWLLSWIFMNNYNFQLLLDIYWVPFIFFLTTGLTGLLIMLCFIIVTIACLLCIVNLTSLILFVCIDDIMDDDW